MLSKHSVSELKAFTGGEQLAQIAPFSEVIESRVIYKPLEWRRDHGLPAKVSRLLINDSPRSSTPSLEEGLLHYPFTGSVGGQGGRG